MTVRTQKNKRNKIRLAAVIALVILLLLATAFADKLAPYDAYAHNYEASLQPPSAAHIMGTDRYGRDVFSRVLVGAQTSISSALVLVAVITVIGTVAGVICGFTGGLPDTIIMRISDVCLAFPGLVFALAIAATLDGGIGNAVIALSAISWPKYARIARSQTLALKNMDYILAARLAGGKNYQIILRHILPNISGYIFVTAALDIGTMMMELAGLSFLGLGALPPTPEWGSMISGGRSMLQTYPWVVIAPGAAIFVCVVLFNLLGDTIRDWLDYKDSGDGVYKK